MKEKSHSMRHCEKYSKYDANGFNEDRHSKHRKVIKERKVYERRKTNHSSDSESSYDSESKEEARKVKEELRKGRQVSASLNSESLERNRSETRTYRIKEEPISDDDFRTNRRYKKESTDRFKSDRPKRSRWNESASQDDDSALPASSKRYRDADKEPRWGKPGEEGTAGDKKKPVVNVAKPDFGLSGKLAEETNTYNGVVIKYSEPPEARKPKRRWRLYPFKGDEGLPALYIHRQSAYLIGRDRKVADLPIDHPSCSKQHAAFQYRLVPFETNDGRPGKRICPYIIDLESANGTFVNNIKIEPKKYVQLFEKDVLKFAFSSREYVLLHEHSKDSDDDDNM